MTRWDVGASILVGGAIVAWALGWIGPPVEHAPRRVQAPIPGCEVLKVTVDLAAEDDSVRVYPTLARCPTPEEIEAGVQVTAVIYDENEIVWCAGACDTIPGWEGRRP